MKESFLIKRRKDFKWLIAPNLAQFPWLLHAFSTRQGGVSGPPAAGLNLGTAQRDQSVAVLENRQIFFKNIQAEDFSLAFVHQIHSPEILQVRRLSKGKLVYLPSTHDASEGLHPIPPSGDAMLTKETGVLLSVRTADCVPILVVDPDVHAVAAIHAGWRGALKRIAEKTIGEMRRLFGSDPRRLFAALGPCIHVCCYEVGEDVFEAFSGQFTHGEEYFRKAADSKTAKRNLPGMSFLFAMPPGHEHSSGSGLRLDLPAVVSDQLRGAGVPASHIQAAEFCTSCRKDVFFSYRKEGSATGRMMAVIGMRK